jgi:putative FmdB family regulatory protein
MPVYDFRCQDCRKRYERFLTYTEYDNYSPVCPNCASKNVHRVIRAVRVSTNDISRLEQMADPENMAALEDDPRRLGKMMRDMREQVGADDLPGEFDEVVDRLEKGQSPDEIEHDLPDLGSPPASDD